MGPKWDHSTDRELETISGASDSSTKSSCGEPRVSKSLRMRAGGSRRLIESPVRRLQSVRYDGESIFGGRDNQYQHLIELFAPREQSTMYLKLPVTTFHFSTSTHHTLTRAPTQSNYRGQSPALIAHSGPQIHRASGRCACPQRVSRFTIKQHRHPHLQVMAAAPECLCEIDMVHARSR